MKNCLLIRSFYVAMAGFSVSTLVADQTVQTREVNLALVAQSSTSFVSGHETITALNNGHTPENSNDKSHGAYGNWPQSGVQWVQYEWTQPVNVARMEVYWFDDHNGVRLPASCRLKYWNGTEFALVANPNGLGLLEHQFNVTTFDPVDTKKLRLEFDSNEKFSTGLLQWRVFDTGKSPNFAPVVHAGVDRVVVQPGKTYLRGTVLDDLKPNPVTQLSWTKVNGPGSVVFADSHASTTAATFSKTGEYTIQLAANDGQLTGTSTLKVLVESAPPAKVLTPVATGAYKISNPLWKARAKELIVHWIPHCYEMISNTNLEEGGIANFIEAGKKNGGKPHGPHKGAVFANAWVHNTVEAMCVALMVDPQGDAEVMAAQNDMRKKLEEWIPVILSAQESDGYLQTCYTLGGMPRWSNKSDHEGYVSGYFIESAIAHFQLTDRKDARMYEAAKKLADCWVSHIGPAPKKKWYDGHQEMEQALMRLARVVDEVEGSGLGNRYADLAKFLMDSRGEGESYDQSHMPVIEQYEAVGHAVRAVYSYSGMADIAMHTGDSDYRSAVKSLWNNLIQRKYYVTGGVGSGETSEGFGNDYSLPNHAYCESCSGCGELFFQHKLNLTYHDALYADLYEETLYNAILGDVDLKGENFTYTNPLDQGFERYKWHGCPCCIGNIPRTLLMLPTWMYVKSADGIHVNLFIGSTVKLGAVSGVNVELTQTTEYPWKNSGAIVVTPDKPARFAMKIRIPSHQASALYTNNPATGGYASIRVNGKEVHPRIEKGYATIQRKWSAGDRIEWVFPMEVQRVYADKRVTADVGRVALRYGPLIYNVESVDQNIDLTLAKDAPLSTEWKPDLLGGMMVIKGSYANGEPLMAIPNYARNNRGGRSIVWIKEK